MEKVKNASDRLKVKDAKKREKLEADNQVNEMKKVLDTLEGRRVLWRIMEFCGLFENRWVPNSARVSYDQGQRNVGLYVLAKVQEADVEKYFEMMREKEERTKEKENG